ncbi:hypothetical protein ACJX0J_018648, partial [Zea mays]
MLNYVILCFLIDLCVYFEKEICTENHITCMLKFQRDNDILIKKGAPIFFFLFKTQYNGGITIGGVQGRASIRLVNISLMYGNEDAHFFYVKETRHGDLPGAEEKKNAGPEGL